MYRKKRGLLINFGFQKKYFLVKKNIMKIDKCMFAFFEMFLQISSEDAENYSCEQSLVSLEEHHSSFVQNGKIFPQNVTVS